MKVSDLIKSEIDKKRYSQREIAKTIGVSDAYMSALLRNCYTRNLPVLMSICDTVGIDHDLMLQCIIYDDTKKLEDKWHGVEKFNDGK